MHRLIPPLLAVMLAACSASEVQSDPPADTDGGDMFALLDEARLAHSEGDLGKAG